VDKPAIKIRKSDMKKPATNVKAYNNLKFLNSPDARIIRILSEYLEPFSRFHRHNIHNFIVFFGSARSKDLETTKKEIVKTATLPDLEEANWNKLRLAEYYEDAVVLAKKLTEWSLDRRTGKQSYMVCSGGGPGMMEAANKGAYLAGGKSIGLNISLPHEQLPNPYISEELQLEFHYFFIRKFWFAYYAKALVIFPGGYGTMDELMEIMTLLQTKKIDERLPVVIYGMDYWNEILDFQGLVRWGTIDESDLNLLYFSDSVEDAFKYLTKRLSKKSRSNKNRD
jgi:uncharacterized protein (TIGR00730 family)